MKTKFPHGFSLVELMVALVISSILLGGVMTIMSSSKKTYTLQSEMSALQDNARFLIDELTYKIRMAGYRGCSQQEGQQKNPFAYSQNSAFNGTPNSDQLTIVSFGEILPLAPGQPLQVGSTTINLDSGFILPPSLSETIWISACGMADPVEYVLKSVDPPNVLNVSPALGRFTGGQVFNGLQEIIYQVKDTPVLGLYKCQDNTPDGQCNDPSQVNTPFIDGVESMQVRYGIATGSQIQFKDTPTTQSDERVIAVRITLLMRTPQKRGIPGTTDKDFYLDPGVTYNPQNNLGAEEGFRHRLFTTTIQVRNSTI